MVMARKQVLVQLNDKLLGQLDRAQAMSGQSRSQLIRTAIAEHLETLLEDDIDRQYVAAYTRTPSDPALDVMSEQLFLDHAAALDAEDGGW
jgi:metal-responsive CopG/Arc/MetJ family transcriptional regulator